ncbi:hypothetical protein M011DRAFT_8796 [Sporormia fimetaria CBS 119925]|uniref:Apple domain-containing protein n=1 Tax=Sporormia fimetaria CBS 119925 TaxID=1340428 RepID=A0A6A6VRM2_9PLEO|nr:hypothetical protein M011DRAFT_8796 [Sporormia fimetaria CBS 119925]
MKAAILIGAALAANVHGAAIDARQIFRTTRVANPPPDGTAAPLELRDPQISLGITLGRPTQSVTFWPNDPDPDSVERCGLDAFLGHEAEASLFCSSILRGGTYTSTATYTSRATTTTTLTVITTLYPPTAPSSTVRPPTSTPRPTSSSVRPPSSTVRPPSSTVRPSSSTVRPPSSTAAPPSSTVRPPSSTSASPSPTPTTTPNCGIAGYTKTTQAYFFDSSGTRNTFAACSAFCKADSKCKSFGYGEANCMLFDVPAADNTNYNPMSPYTFYDAACPAELPVRKRQINIELPGLGPGAISSACSCLITRGPGEATRVVTTTLTSNRITKTETITRTVSLLPDAP